MIKLPYSIPPLCNIVNKCHCTTGPLLGIIIPVNPQGMNTGYASLIVAMVVAFVGATGYLGYQDFKLTKEKVALEEELTKIKQEFATQSQILLENIDSVKQILAATQSDRNNLEQDLRQERELVDGMEAQVQFMASTVGTLKKLTDTDKELLKKYSRVYFLNENYAPKNLLPIAPQYMYEMEKEQSLSGETLPFLQKMLDDTSNQNIDLKIISAYRSFGIQSTLKSAYTFTYGSGANKFSADQGYSEHQLGTTIDFTTAKLGINFTAFENTDGYAWLVQNAYKYGFVLSYPKNNGYYIFEPWHWRFVGKGLALKLHSENKNFYDITQREIDEFLVTLFDQ